jgi:7,8-dihydroneopterin aldolase/epimerase/oxygenase
MLLIHLQNLQFKAYHGLYEEEKILGNHFTVNMIIQYQPQNLPIVSINQTINYQTIFELVEQRMQIATELLETLVIDIAHKIFDAFLLVEEIDICIAKQNPPIQNFMGNVTVSFNKKRNHK